MSPSDFDQAEFDPGEFSGTVRMFPIPNLVMFPHVVQPLHVFEERYREMMSDALVGDRLLAMPILKPGWEPDYAGRPPVEPWACLGKVVLHNKLPDGCYNLLLMGVSRIKITEELAPLRSFRQAKAELVADIPLYSHSDEAEMLHQRIVEVFDQRMATGDAPCSLKPLLENNLPLATLTDLVAYALPLGHKQKLELLSQPCVAKRARLLLECLGVDVSKPQPTMLSVGHSAGFPPPFSDN